MKNQFHFLNGDQDTLNGENMNRVSANIQNNFLKYKPFNEIIIHDIMHDIVTLNLNFKLKVL